MSDIPSQPSDQPMPSEQPNAQLSGKPMATRELAAEALASSPRGQRRMRLWPGVAIFAVQWAIVGVLQLLFSGEPLGFMSMLIGPMIGTVVLIGWWLFFSRLSWRDRLGVPAACLVIVALVVVVAHPTIKGMATRLRLSLLAEVSGILWLLVSYPLVWLLSSYSVAWQGPPCGVAAWVGGGVWLLHTSSL